MSREQINSFLFRRGYVEIVETFPDQEKLYFFEAVCNYALDGVEPKLSDDLLAKFEQIRTTIDKDILRFQERRKG